MRDIYGPNLATGILDPVSQGATYQVWGSSASYFTIDGSNPGTRECFVMAWRVALQQPARVYGVGNVLTGTFTTAGINPKMRFALFSSQGNAWKSGGVNNAMPNKVLAYSSTGQTLSTMTGIITSGRRLYQAFDNPTSVIMPQALWVVGICECVYSGVPETNPTAVFGAGSDVNGPYTNSLGTTGAHRNIALKAIQTGGIDTLNFSSYEALADTSWTAQLGASTGFSLTGRTLSVPSGVSMGNWHINLHCQPYD